MRFILARSADTVRAPVLACVTSERARALGRTPVYVPLAPTSRSRSSRRTIARQTSTPRLPTLWRPAGASWVVDPAGERVHAYRSLFAPKLLAGADELDGEEVVPGFRLAIAEPGES